MDTRCRKLNERHGACSLPALRRNQPWRQELNVGGAEDDGGCEADDGEVKGIGIEKSIPGEGEAGLEPAKLH